MSFRSLTVRLLAPGALLVTAACVGATDATVATSATSPSSTVTTTTIAAPACVAALSVEQKAGQLLMVLVPTPAAALVRVETTVREGQAAQAVALTAATETALGRATTGLEAAMTPQALADLIAYLKQPR